MYKNEIELFFGEDEKTVTITFEAETLDEVKNHDLKTILQQEGDTYSMLPGEVVISSNITFNGEYVDHDEDFFSYKPSKKVA